MIVLFALLKYSVNLLGVSKMTLQWFVIIAIINRNFEANIFYSSTIESDTQ